MIHQTTRLIPILALAGLLTACGGGGSSSDDDTGSTPSRQLSTGVITGFGSIYVNNQRFGTNSARFEVAGDGFASQSDLQVGMRVSVESESSTMEASRVSYDEDVEGPIDATVADFASPFSVMGQQVIVDAATIVDSSISFPVNAGEILEISGMRQADDSILATYIEDKAAGDVDEYQVIGPARSVDTMLKTFMIGNLMVSYAGAEVDDLPGGNPIEGEIVEVEDENRAYVAGSNMLNATEVEPYDPLEGNNGNPVANIEIETVVTSVITPEVQFTIPGFTVNILPGTSFLFGTAADIGVGTLLQVKGIRNGDEIDATRIRFKRNSARIEASIDAGGIDVGANQVTILGIMVQLNAETEMEDGRDDVSPFTINDLSDGDFVEIRGYIAADGTLIASELERDDSDNEAEIRGIASNVNPVSQSLEVLGIAVTAGPGTEFNDNLVSADTFFGSITDGLTVVSVEWEPYVSTSVAPSEMEVEDNFDDGTP